MWLKIQWIPQITDVLPVSIVQLAVNTLKLICVLLVTNVQLSLMFKLLAVMFRKVNIKMKLVLQFVSNVSQDGLVHRQLRVGVSRN
jgi:hypothetical protein